MRHLRLWGVGLLCFGLIACAKAQVPNDAGTMVEEMVPYEGEAAGNLPDFTPGLFDAGDNSPIDAGPIIVDTRCCKLRLSIASSGEPLHAVGVVKGEANPLASGVALSRDGDAGFSANVCFPVNSSSFYWYEFEWVTGDADAGGVLLEDGGVWMHVRRHSETELNYPVGDGTYQNYIPSVDDCALLDAGTGP